MFRFFLFWCKTVQYDANKYKEVQKTEPTTKIRNGIVHKLGLQQEWVGGVTKWSESGQVHMTSFAFQLTR